MRPKPKPKHWWYWPWRLVKFVALSVLSAFLVFQIFAFIKRPDAGVAVQGLTQNYCVYYMVTFAHSRTIDGVNFSIRFPSRLNDRRIGIVENVGTDDEEKWMRVIIREFDMNACGFGTTGNPIDTSAITSSITGNTLSVHSGTLTGHTPIQGFVVGPMYQSTSEPAPKEPMFEGKYSYNVFGISVERSIKFVNLGTTEMKPAQ